jgi:hypothetical protein
MQNSYIFDRTNAKKLGRLPVDFYETVQIYRPVIHVDLNLSTTKDHAGSAVGLYRIIRTSVARNHRPAR